MKKLNTPSVSLVHNAQTNETVVSWNDVANATGDVVVIKNGEEEKVCYVASNFSQMMIVDDFTSVKVKAIGSGNFIDSEFSNNVSK